MSAISLLSKRVMGIDGKLSPEIMQLKQQKASHLVKPESYLYCKHLQGLLCDDLQSSVVAGGWVHMTGCVYRRFCFAIACYKYRWSQCNAQESLSDVNNLPLKLHLSPDAVFFREPISSLFYGKAITLKITIVCHKQS